ncbi:hypothetical protein LTR08_009087 [Meristemomyces frigidus]|nr:hypothetical protein LTR08_009087 [Meristemomyces frigidus]
MAEQVSHHVVTPSESAGASAPAGVASNPTDTDAAAQGTATTMRASGLADPKSDEAPVVDSGAVAEPSAGEDAAGVAGGEAGAGEAEVGVDEAKEVAGEGLVALSNGTNDPALGEGSQNSDTEGSRGDGTEQKQEGSHHVRTNSAKKPTTFSRVSVTKNFMAKTASPAPTAAVIGSKPSLLNATPQLAAAIAKPRLVAKTGALKTLQKPRTGSESASGPDASKVWNKNRPVAPPPPKQFTDEELKQQYGIHLATRLQADENGTESKWADIDEDEEDWTPETVVWMDGTKSTITPADIAPPQSEPKPAAPRAAKPAEAVRPVLALKKPTDMGPPKTILKPGMQVKQQLGPTASTPSTEKPSLKAKDLGGPAKSPWAALPPIEAVPLINPPVQQTMPPVSLPSQDARSYEAQAPSYPAREIAADTFERFSREGEGPPRELFNSANGRYEPAPEGRRTSVKHDGPPRKPSVLQRPSQNGHSPAEPSAAFQARSSSQVDGSPWSRRRGSSVSQVGSNSGLAARRISMSRPTDLPPAFEERERRQSKVSSQDVRGSPQLARIEPAKAAFTQQSAWDQQMPPKPETGTETALAAPAEDPIKGQERVMREKREEAKRRRQEEEDQDEKEKQERLKARLASLAGAGKSRKERESEAAAAAAAAKKPVVAKPSEPTAPVERTEVPVEPTEASAVAAPALEDQTVATAPPIATPQEPPIEEEPPSPLLSKATALPERSSSSTDQAQRQAPRAHLSPRANVRTPFGQQSSPYRPPNSSFSSPGERKQQLFNRSPLTNADAFSGWNTTAPNGNVWGTSGIGNGTFEKAGSFAPVPFGQQSLPPPPGMPRSSPASSRISPQAFGQDSRTPGLQQQQFPPPGIESRPDNAWGQPRSNGVSPAPGMGRQAHLPGPIGPPSRAQQAQQQPPVQRQDPLAAWSNAATSLPHQYAADANAAVRKQHQTAAVAPSPREDSFKETYKQTSTGKGRLGGPRRFDKTEYTVHDAQGSRAVETLAAGEQDASDIAPPHLRTPAPPNTQTQPTGPVPTASPLNDTVVQHEENAVRIPDGSLNPAHGGSPVQQPAIAPPPVQQAPTPTPYVGQVNFPTGPLPGVVPPAKDQSPPPPETSDHPVNSGDVQHPSVRLPPPPPRVKLPPSPAPMQAQMQQTPVVMPQRPVHVWGPPGVARPLVLNEDWQARFNGLFNRAPIQTEVPPSPPGTPPKMQGEVLAVAAESRIDMDEMPIAVGATVSLPQSPPRRTVTLEGFTIDGSEDVVSKPSIDDMFRDELSFGSIPVIIFPRVAAYGNKTLGITRHNMLKMPTNSMVHKYGPDAQTGEDLTAGPNLLHYFYKHPQGYYLKIPGTRLNNRIVRTAVQAANRKASQQQERKASAKFAGKGKGPEAKGGSNKGSGSTTPVTNGTPVAGSRQASFQKASSAATVDPAGPANVEGGSKKHGGKWNKRTAPVKAS